MSAEDTVGCHSDHEAHQHLLSSDGANDVDHKFLGQQSKSIYLSIKAHT
jgi:hypothetical protein